MRRSFNTTTTGDEICSMQYLECICFLFRYSLIFSLSLSLFYILLFPLFRYFLVSFFLVGFPISALCLFNSILFFSSSTLLCFVFLFHNFIFCSWCLNSISFCFDIFSVNYSICASGFHPLCVFFFFSLC